MSDNFAVWGAITAMRHLLAGVFETSLLECDAPLEDLELTKKRFLAELEPGLARGLKGENKVMVLHHATSFMEDFWKDMEEQVRHQLEP